MSDVTEATPSDRSGRGPKGAIGATIAGVLVLGGLATFLWRAKKPATTHPDSASIAFEPAPLAQTSPDPEPVVEPFAAEVEAAEPDEPAANESPVASDDGAPTGDATFTADEPSVTDAESPRPDPYLEAIWLDPLSARDRRRLPRRS